MGFKQLAGSVFFLLCLLGTSTSTTTGNCGQEFVFSPMPNYLGTGSFGVIIQVCSVKSRVRISVQSQELDNDITIAPNSWPYDYPLSSLAANLINSTISGPIKDSTIAVRSDEDISVLMYNVKFYSSDIYTALPEKNLGDEHFVALIGPSERANASGVISISSRNQTSAIEIHLTSTLKFMGAIFYSGNIITYTLLPFESIQLLPPYTNITGTRVLSNVSIAVSAGCTCAQVPEGTSGCDYLAEQLAPFKAWGKQFVVSPFALRRSGYILQIVAGRDNTVIAFNNSDILELNMGRYHTVDITSQKMIFVSANKPISIMQYPKGAGTDDRDDPSMIRVTPNEQFVTDATFPVYKFSGSAVRVRYLGITAECRYMDRVNLTKNGAQITPTLVEYSNVTYNGIHMCSWWSEIGHGWYSLSSQPVTLPDGKIVSPRFRAVVYGSSGRTGSESYLYRAASNDRPLTCTRNSGSSTQEFDCPEYCSPTQIGNMSFPQGEVGVPMDSLQTCPRETALGGQPIDRAVCMNNASFGPLWKVIQHNDCSQVRERGREQILQEILERKITEDTAERVIEETAAVSRSPDELTQTDVANIALIIKNITNLKTGEPKVTSLMTNIISNTADVNEEDLYEVESSTGAITEILEAFEEQLKYVEVPEGETYILSTTNVAVQVTDVAPVNFSSGLNLTGEHFNFTANPSVSNNGVQEADGTIQTSHVPFQVAIPSSVFDGPAKGNNIPAEGKGVRVALAVFRTPSLFASRSLREVNEMKTDFNRSANSLVVGLTVGDEQKTILKENIVFTFKPIKSGYQDPVCVFWYTDIPDWSTNGCQQITSQNEISDQTYDTTGTIICSCNHLTNFAVLMDIHASKNPPVPVLRTLSFIGCSISILSLVITLITFLSTKKLHAHQSQKIFLCLCATLLCLYITFIIMSALDTYPGMSHIPEVAAGPCGFLAALVHFFTISSLAWMGVEAFNTYLVIVRVFNSYIPHFMIRACLVAWGASGLIVALTGAVARESYASSDYCFLQYWSLVGGLVIPVALILFFNTVVFILVVRRLARSASLSFKDDDTECRKETLERVKNAVGIFILLGLTWITGYFTLIESSTFVAQVLFIIFNSLQGLLILILYCLRNPVVRSHWRKMVPRACRRSEGSRRVSYQSKTERISSTSGRILPASSSANNPTLHDDDPSTSMITFKGEVSQDPIPY